MRKEFDRFLIITEPYGARTGYPLSCREDAADDLATALYYDSDLAYGAFCAYVDECAAEDGYTLKIVSGFRSFETQYVIYWRYVRNDGQKAADTYSARPGHSEHQTGLAMDLNSLKSAFGDTPEGKWLAAHCHEYGFILRYPQGKQNITGYKYESWHIRYVGTDMSYAIHNSGLTLEEYFGIDSYYH